MARRSGRAVERGVRKILSIVGAPLLGTAGFIAVWWTAVASLQIAPYLVPAPPAVVSTNAAPAAQLAALAPTTPGSTNLGGASFLAASLYDSLR